MLDHDVFSDAFHCVVCPRDLVLDQIDLAKGASTDDANELKVVEGYLAQCHSSVKTDSTLVAGLADLVER